MIGERTMENDDECFEDYDDVYYWDDIDDLKLMESYENESEEYLGTDEEEEN